MVSAVSFLLGIILSAAEQVSEILNGLFQRCGFVDILAQKVVDGINPGDGMINFGVGTLGVGPDIDQIFGLFVGGEDTAGMTGKFDMAWGDNV